MKTSIVLDCFLFALQIALNQLKDILEAKNRLSGINVIGEVVSSNFKKLSMQIIHSCTPGFQHHQ